MQEQAAQLEEMVSTFKLDTTSRTGLREAMRRPVLALGN
jgi:methyl-accepting chemotaxis protein-1 (serine sensor receptor)